MAWKELEAPPPVVKGVGPQIKIGYTKSGGAFLSIPESIALSLGVKAGDTFKVSVGSAEAIGRIRIQECAGKGFIAYGAIKGSIRIRLGPLPDMPAPYGNARVCTYEVVGSDRLVLEIDLPWEVRGPRDVTDNIIDPGPGKRAGFLGS